MTSETLTFLADSLLYTLVASFAAYATVYALPLGITLFSACALLASFVGATYSLFRLLTRSA